MTQREPLWLNPTEGEPYAEVERVGRWTYRVSISRGCMVTPGWYVLGRKHAERKARRVLARYKRKQGWRSDACRIS